MEVICKGRTIEEAVEEGAKKLGKNVSEVKYSIVEEAKKGFLGMFSSEATVKVFYNDDGNYDDGEELLETRLNLNDNSELADLSDNENQSDEENYFTKQNLVPVQEKIVEFLNSIISDMGVDAEAQVNRVDEKLSENTKTYEKDIHIEITGNGLGILIGRHGDVLDSLQYLANIVVGRYPKNPEKHEYVRVILDIENYRVKREETLKSLAKRMASRVVSSGRNFTLEPMSSYERRIIHSELQSFSGVHTFSVGAENNRRVVIAYGESSVRK